MFERIKKISIKLGLVFGFILVMLIGTSIFSILSYIGSMDTYKQYVYNRFKQIDSVLELTIELKSLVQEAKDIFLRGDNPQEFNKHKKQFDMIADYLLEGVKELKNDRSFVDNESKNNLINFEGALRNLLVKYDESFKVYALNSDFKAADAVIKGADRPVTDIADKMVASLRFNTETQSKAIARLVMQKVVLIIIVVILASILGIIFAVMVAKNISNPIAALNNAANLVAQGDLTIDVKVKSKDEVGGLADSFDKMVNNLHEITRKINNAASQIAAASGGILTASQQQAVGAREQSSAINETTSAATELSKNAEQVGENIKRVAVISNHALVGMAKIKESLDKTGQSITSLSEKSQQISKITELINDVADQTNLLAVNAAIEAARAGEEGRGFAVVADEIRKLSDSTTKSTKEISALIEIIQHEISNAIISMEQSANNVNEETKLSQQSAESAKEISMNAAQQVSGTKQIANAMSAINESMKQISISSAQAQAAAKQLDDLSGEINSLTSKFKIE